MKRKEEADTGLMRQTGTIVLNYPNYCSRLSRLRLSAGRKKPLQKPANKKADTTAKLD
jgi:hypothetical protein